MKFMVVFICVILVLYGFYGLTVRESIVFTFLGFSISAIFAAFAGMWIIAMAATVSLLGGSMMNASGLAPIFPYTFYHLTHYWFAAADIPVANDTPVHYADAIRCNVRRPPQGSLPLLTRRVSA